MPRVHPSITLARLDDALSRYDTTLDNPGFCLTCGADADNCEPDARRYTCEACENESVYGAQECLLAGFYHV